MLQIYVRQPGISIGFVVMTQILIAFAGGACVNTEQIAVMAATDHQYVAVVLAVESMFTSIGGGIGSTISTAIWNAVFPKKLAEYLPPESQHLLKDIYSGLPKQLIYPKGTPTRVAIERAYGDAQKWNSVAGAVIIILGFPAVMMWRNFKVKDFKQVKGNVV
jgi:hypothetical protein